MDILHLCAAKCLYTDKCFGDVYSMRVRVRSLVQACIDTILFYPSVRAHVYRTTSGRGGDFVEESES